MKWPKDWGIWWHLVADSWKSHPLSSLRVLSASLWIIGEVEVKQVVVRLCSCSIKSGCISRLPGRIINHISFTWLNMYRFYRGGFNHKAWFQFRDAGFQDMSIPVFDARRCFTGCLPAFTARIWTKIYKILSKRNDKSPTVWVRTWEFS